MRKKKPKFNTQRNSIRAKIFVWTVFNIYILVIRAQTFSVSVISIMYVIDMIIDNGESTCAYYLKKILNLVDVNSSITCSYLMQTLAAKWFQTRTEEEIGQLLHDRSSKSTNKATDNAVRTLRDFSKEQNLDESFQELSKTDLNLLLRKFCNKVVSWHPCIVLFWVGRYNTTLNDWSFGKQRVLFPLDPQYSPGRGLGETKLTFSLGAGH